MSLKTDKGVGMLCVSQEMDGRPTWLNMQTLIYP